MTSMRRVVPVFAAAAAVLVASIIAVRMCSRSANAISVHIGLSAVNQLHYQWSGRCDVCLNDTNFYYKTAKEHGYEARQPLLNKDATTVAVEAALREAAADLESRGGGTLLVTFSGHGARIPPDGEEDQAWCLFDRELLDDELNAILVDIPASIRVVFISDSCYSAGILQNALFVRDATVARWFERAKVVPEYVQTQLYARHEKSYKEFERVAREKIAGRPVAARVIVLAAASKYGIALRDEDRGYSSFTAAIIDTFTPRKGLLRLFRDAQALTHSRENTQFPALETVDSVSSGDLNQPIFPPD